MSVVQLDVRRSKSLTAAIQVMATMPREAAKETRKYSKAVIVPEWKEAIAQRATTHSETVILARPSTVYVTDRGVRLVAGKGDRIKQTEFGADRDHRGRYWRQGRRNRTLINRHTQRQFTDYQSEGHVVYPSASTMIPRVASLWVQTIYRTVAEVIERHING